MSLSSRISRKSLGTFFALACSLGCFLLGVGILVAESKVHDFLVHFSYITSMLAACFAIIFLSSVYKSLTNWHSFDVIGWVIDHYQKVERSVGQKDQRRDFKAKFPTLAELVRIFDLLDLIRPEDQYVTDKLMRHLSKQGRLFIFAFLGFVCSSYLWNLVDGDILTRQVSFFEITLLATDMVVKGILFDVIEHYQWNISEVRIVNANPYSLYSLFFRCYVSLIFIGSVFKVISVASFADRIQKALEETEGDRKYGK